MLAGNTVGMRLFIIFLIFPTPFSRITPCYGPVVSAYVLKFQVLKLDRDLNDGRKHKHKGPLSFVPFHKRRLIIKLRKLSAENRQILKTLTTTFKKIPAAHNDVYIRPRPHVSGYFESATFSFRIRKYPRPHVM